MKKRHDYKFLLLVAVIMVAGIGIAYAALSTTLTITFGTITQNALTWDVGFTGTSATATAGGTSATGRTCGNASITASSVTIANTTLSKPGDKCTWELTVANNGTVNATLGGITPTAPTSITCGTASGANLVCGNITYNLTTDSGGSTLLTTGGALNSGATQKIYLVAKYNASGLQSSAITHNGAKFTLTYNQA
ncbi:MAG: hypothetical protein IKQ06_04675 [Bacilli bacterium]|nr:hypothetical protein [Bacilli bacterium]MBR6137432.1 hypothetical protein [Bacilli bacterium]